MVVIARGDCELIGISRSLLNYHPVRAEHDASVIATMKRLAQHYPHYGYRRIRIFLKREGYSTGWQRAHRLWKAAGLQFPRRRTRLRIASSRPWPLPLFVPNGVWAYDFVFDGCANGQNLKCLTIVGEYTRECPTIDVAGSIRSGRVIEGSAA